MTTSFALFRPPYSETFTEVRSERKPVVVPSFGDIGTASGFVIAPFDGSCADAPIVLIRPDSVLAKPLDNVQVAPKDCSVAVETMSEAYKNDFRRFHDAVSGGAFRKLVLSRTKETEFLEPDLRRLFAETCHRYPRLCVMLVSTPLTGTWLVATPERLLVGDGTWWKTTAMAGTMPYEGGFQEWSVKNRQEQHIVETYIEDRLPALGKDMIKDGPFTRRAGNLVHLCTDFRFHIASGHTVGDVLSALHPTPAVCGIPKEEAYRFIKENEHTPRLYYSGFMGPVGIDGKTLLYVSLRCARLNGNRAVLYAGGGIMPGSEALSEWEETENKMHTVGDVLR